MRMFDVMLMLCAGLARLARRERWRDGSLSKQSVGRNVIDLTVGLVLGVRMGADTSDASRTDSEASHSVMAVKVIVVRRGVGRCVLHVDWILCGRVDGWMMRGVTASVWSTGRNPTLCRYR